MWGVTLLVFPSETGKCNYRENSRETVLVCGWSQNRLPVYINTKHTISEAFPQSAWPVIIIYPTCFLPEDHKGRTGATWGKKNNQRWRYPCWGDVYEFSQHLAFLACFWMDSVFCAGPEQADFLCHHLLRSRGRRAGSVQNGTGINPTRRWWWLASRTPSCGSALGYTTFWSELTSTKTLTSRSSRREPNKCVKSRPINATLWI